MAKPLKQAIRQHLQQRSLSAEQLQALQSIMQQSDAVKPAVKVKRGLHNIVYALIGAAAACIIMLVGFFSPVNPFATDAEQTHALLANIAAEVAENHLTLKPADIETNNLDTLRNYFTLLNFKPIASQRLSDSSWQLTGGRYCSIQGQTAAQLRLNNPDGESQTLYQTLYDGALASKLSNVLPNPENQSSAAIVQLARGLEVELWVENGILFALAQE